MAIWYLVLYCVSFVRVTFRGRAEEFWYGSNAGPDRLPALSIPSVAADGPADRALAEIDQDGYLFAYDHRDKRRFDRSSEHVPRRTRRLQVVLRDGVVCVRKWPPHCSRASRSARFRDWIGWGFYLETAALLRLQGLPCVPRLHSFDVRSRTIDMEYVVGGNLRNELLSYEDIRALRDQIRCYLPQCTEVVAALASRGVIPLDLHPANFIRGRETGRLYIVDFHLVYDRALPGWERLQISSKLRLVQTFHELLHRWRDSRRTVA